MKRVRTPWYLSLFDYSFNNRKNTCTLHCEAWNAGHVLVFCALKKSNTNCIVYIKPPRPLDFWINICFRVLWNCSAWVCLCIKIKVKLLMYKVSVWCGVYAIHRCPYALLWRVDGSLPHPFVPQVDICECKPRAGMGLLQTHPLTACRQLPGFENIQNVRGVRTGGYQGPDETYIVKVYQVYLEPLVL